jgi:hypothetical protein
MMSNRAIVRLCGGIGSHNVTLPFVRFAQYAAHLRTNDTRGNENFSHPSECAPHTIDRTLPRPRRAISAHISPCDRTIEIGVLGAEIPCPKTSKTHLSPAYLRFTTSDACDALEGWSAKIQLCALCEPPPSHNRTLPLCAAHNTAHIWRALCP